MQCYAKNPSDGISRMKVAMCILGVGQLEVVVKVL
jgi:hypothetical protein